MRTALVCATTILATAASGGSPAAATDHMYGSPGATVHDHRGPGCDHDPAVADSHVEVISDGATYPVRVHVPSGYQASEPTPVVINLHGSSSTGALQAAMTGMDAEADRSGFIVAYPDGGVAMPSGYAWNVPGVPLVTGAPVPDGSRDDAAFIADVVATLRTTFCADDKKTFATGMSGGGRMASYLACSQADTFAAVAAVGGVRAGHGRPGQPREIANHSCRPSQPVAVLAIHGQRDTVNPYTGNTSASWGYSVLAALDRWATLDHCRSSHSSTRVTATVRQLSWRGCAGSVKLLLSSVAGHTWPQATIESPQGATDRSINANHRIWTFFAHHAR